MKNITVHPEYFMQDENLFEFFFKRNIDAHKGDYGKFLIVSGSKSRSGGPVLSALSALRTGIDIVSIFAPKDVSNIIRSSNPNLTSVYDYRYGNVEETLNTFNSIYERFDSYLVATDPETASKDKFVNSTFKSIVKRIIEKDKKFILDAGCFYIFTPEDISNTKCVITPHSGEYKIFLNNYKSKDEPEFCVLLKEHEDKIFYRSQRAVNKTGNPGMTVAGTGDVLSGILGAILTQTDDLFKGSCAAAYISGLAGDLAFKKFGYSLISTDVIEAIPEAIKNCGRCIYR